MINHEAHEQLAATTPTLAWPTGKTTNYCHTGAATADRQPQQPSPPTNQWASHEPPRTTLPARPPSHQRRDDTGHVFTMEDGRALDPAYITRTFAKFRKQGELLPPLTPHGLRHTFTSLGLEEGIDISILSKVLGHKSVQTTADIYAHLTEGAGQKAVDGVADRIAHTLLTSEGVST